MEAVFPPLKQQDFSNLSRISSYQNFFWQNRENLLVKKKKNIIEKFVGSVKLFAKPKTRTTRAMCTRVNTRAAQALSWIQSIFRFSSDCQLISCVFLKNWIFRIMSLSGVNLIEIIWEGLSDNFYLLKQCCFLKDDWNW